MEICAGHCFPLPGLPARADLTMGRAIVYFTSSLLVAVLRLLASRTRKGLKRTYTVRNVLARVNAVYRRAASRWLHQRRPLLLPWARPLSTGRRRCPLRGRCCQALPPHRLSEEERRCSASTEPVAARAPLPPSSTCCNVR